jgi:transglutaminase-like putative cysteine protease
MKLFILRCFFFSLFFIRSDFAAANDTIQKLVLEITKHCKNDSQKAWAIYNWITTNVAYDYERMRLATIPELPPDRIFEIRKGVCSDYAVLAKAMFQVVNIKCVIVSGIAKNDDEDLVNFNVEDRAHAHAWNAIYLDNKWQLLDCTWGWAKTTVNRTDERYFLTPPEQFIFSHYPTENNWNLLDKAIKIEEFIDYPVIADYFSYTNLLPPSNGIFKLNTDSLIIHNLGLSTVYDSIEFQLFDIEKDEEVAAIVDLLEKDQRNFSIKLKMTIEGKFYLRVFLRRKLDNNFYEFKKLITFLIIKD